MANQPFFPPPRKKDGVYREPATRPLPDPAPQPKRVVVSRPEEFPSSTPQPKAIAAREALVDDLVAKEQTYWERHRTFARFPRLIGGVAVLLGGWIAWGSVDTLLHGGVYFVRGTLFGPVGVLAGAWALLFGYPLERNGRPPPWWVLGQVTCIVAGLCLGAGLLALLAAAGAY